jgi:hypothetical protein
MATPVGATGSKVRFARDTPATLDRALKELDECIGDLA